MPVTWLDLLLLAIMLVSGVLAMIRGFMREILSIVAWAGAAVATVTLYERALPIAESNLGPGTLAKVVVILGLFILALIILTVITARISDLVLDSRIGALDRTLGLVFGLARGLLIVVVAFHLFAWLVQPDKQPEGVRNAKSREILQSTGNWLQSLLPPDTEKHISNWLTTMFGRKAGRPDQDAPEPAPGRRSERAAPPPAEQGGYDRVDRTGMRRLIEGATR